MTLRYIYICYIQSIEEKHLRKDYTQLTKITNQLNSKIMERTQELSDFLKVCKAFIPDPTVVCSFSEATEEGVITTKYGQQRYVPGYFIVTTGIAQSAVAPQKFAVTYTRSSMDTCFKSAVQKGILIRELTDSVVKLLNSLSVDGTKIVKDENGDWSVKTLESTGGVKNQSLKERYVLFFDVEFKNGQLGIGNIYPCSLESFNQKYIH